MDLLLIAYSLTMAILLTLAGMEVNRRLASRRPDEQVISTTGDLAAD